MGSLFSSIRSGWPLFLLLILPPLFPRSVEAQRGLQLDLFGGGHNSWLLNSDEGENEDLERRFTPGFSAGVDGSYYFTPEVGFGVGTLLSYQGQNYYHALDFEPHRSSRRLLYARVPLTLSYRSELGKQGLFRSSFGPSVGTPLFARHTREGKEEEAPLSNPWISSYRSMVVGFHASLGFGRWWDNTKGALLELHFSHGLTNAEEKGSPLVPNHRQETYNASLGLRFRFFFSMGGRQGAASLGYP